MLQKSDFVTVPVVPRQPNQRFCRHETPPSRRARQERRDVSRGLTTYQAMDSAYGVRQVDRALLPRASAYDLLYQAHNSECICTPEMESAGPPHRRPPM